MAIRPVVVSFQAEGVRDVTRSFQTIANAAANAEKASIRSHDRVANQAIKSYSRTSDAKKRETKAAISDDEKLAQSKRKLSQEIEAIERRQSDRRMREIERQLKADIKADDARAKSAQKASDQIARIHAKESAAAKRIGDGIGRTVGGSVRGVIGGASRLAGTAMAVGGGFSIVDSLQDTIRNRGKAADIAIQSGGDISRDALLKQSDALSQKYGFTVGSVLDAADRYGAKSGDYSGASGVLENILKLSNATGGDPEELAAVAGIYKANNQNASQDDVDRWLRTSAGMGRKGSVDMRELAQYGGRISAASGLFANKNTAFTELSAITQVAAAKGGAMDAAGSTEAVKRFAEDVSNNRDAFKTMTHGTSAFDKSGNMIDPKEIIKVALSSTKGDEGLLHDVFKRESIMAVRGFASTYRDTYNATSGSAKDKDARAIAEVEKEFKRMTGAVLEREQVERESAKRMEETDKKLIAVFEKLKIEVGEKLAPKFMELIPVLEKAIPAFTEMLDFATKNPFSSIALLMGAAVTKDIAAAGIGKGIEIGVAKAATAIASGGVSIKTSIGSVAMVITAAAIALEQGIEKIDEMFKKKTEEQNGDALRGGNIEQKRAALIAKVQSGTATPADIEQAKRDLATAEGDVASQAKRLDPENKSLTEKLIGAAGTVVPGMDDALAVEDRSARAEYARAKQSVESFTKTIEAAAKAIEDHSKKVSGSPGGKGDANSPARINSLASPKRGGHQ